MKYGSLFTGIGGMALGLDRAGMECRWQVEIDPFCRKVLTKHWPNVEKHEDVRTVGKHNLESVGLIAGGFPCQDVSVAGNQVGIVEGNRSGLWFEFHRIICELRPRYALIENVPGLIGNGLDRVLSDLASSGYDAEWEIVSACSVGAPHMRKRVFVIAYPDSIGFQGRERRMSEVANGRAFNASIFSAPKRGTWNDLPTPRICRGADGIPNRAQRIKGLGNAVVPQVAEYIGRQIINFDSER